MTRRAPFVRMDSTCGCFSGLRGAFNRETRPVSACYPVRVPDDGFSDEDFFRAIIASCARVLLIGRRALVTLGAPVMPADYDLWVHIDDIEKLNAVFEPLGHMPNRTPTDARLAGRYFIENGERVDVLVARASSGANSPALSFDEAWSRRERVDLGRGLAVDLPCIDDLIATKRWAARAKDLIDVQSLEGLRRAKGSDGP